MGPFLIEAERKPMKVIFHKRFYEVYTKDLRLPAGEEKKILWKNAAQLFKLDL